MDRGRSQQKAIFAKYAESDGKIKFYDLKAKKSIKIHYQKVHSKVAKNGVLLLHTTHPTRGYELYRIAGRHKKH